VITVLNSTTRTPLRTSVTDNHSASPRAPLELIVGA
jgi:hypothetical protein